MTVLIWCSIVNVSGGMERIAATLATGLSEMGHTVLLVGPFAELPSDLESKIGPRVRLVPHHSPGGIRGLVVTAQFLASLVRTYNVDIISAHGNVLPLVGIPVPVLWTEHSVRYRHKRMMRDRRAPLWLWVRSRLLTRQWQVACVSRFVLSDLENQMHLPQGIGRVLYNGLADTTRLCSLPPPRLQQPYQIGFIGRLEDEKRPRDIFELSRLLAEAGILCQWHIFGDGALASSIRARAQALDDRRIVVHGYIPDILDIFRQVDAIIMTSQMEGLPTVLLEATLARRIIVAWRAAGIPEAAGQHAFLADPPFELPRLAAAVAEAFRRPGVPPPPSHTNSFPEMIDSYETLLREMSLGRRCSDLSRANSEKKARCE